MGRHLVTTKSPLHGAQAQQSLLLDALQKRCARTCGLVDLCACTCVGLHLQTHMRMRCILGPARRDAGCTAKQRTHFQNSRESETIALRRLVISPPAPASTVLAQAPHWKDPRTQSLARQPSAPPPTRPGLLTTRSSAGRVPRRRRSPFWGGRGLTAGCGPMLRCCLVGAAMSHVWVWLHELSMQCRWVVDAMRGMSDANDVCCCLVSWDRSDPGCT